ncbi:putative transcription factor interactor and regulator CCHC(Zn) family [Helianthus annuus]|nr:putative transcription factor interactor and regulator CCHC(Zn) family [Helianthus annuus]
MGQHMVSERGFQTIKHITHEKSLETISQHKMTGNTKFIHKTQDRRTCYYCDEPRHKIQRCKVKERDEAASLIPQAITPEQEECEKATIMRRNTSLAKPNLDVRMIYDHGLDSEDGDVVRNICTIPRCPRNGL